MMSAACCHMVYWAIGYTPGNSRSSRPVPNTLKQWILPQVCKWGIFVLKKSENISIIRSIGQKL